MALNRPIVLGVGTWEGDFLFGYRLFLYVFSCLFAAPSSAFRRIDDRYDLFPLLLLFSL